MSKNIYQTKQDSSEILKDLSPKQKEVIIRRFGLSGKEGETLEAIGKDFKVTRERIRQIERDGFLELESNIKKNKKVFENFKKEIKAYGGLKREDLLLNKLAKTEEGDSPSPDQGSINEAYFLLTLGKDFQRFSEGMDYHAFWTIDKKYFDQAKKIIELAIQKFKKINKPLKITELDRPKNINLKVFSSYLEISKNIKSNSEGLWGLKDWPEINPKTIKDKAYLVFKKAEKPLHFNNVAQLIDLALPQTVHNELIKDSRFVLVGRGIYALKEWGYQEGLVKDIISNILKAAGRPLKREEVLEKISKQRLVKENTVFLNLSNKKYFSRTSEGYYKIREA